MHLLLALFRPWQLPHQLQHHQELPLHQGVVLVLHVGQRELKLLLHKVFCLLVKNRGCIVLFYVATLLSMMSIDPVFYP